MAYVPQSHVVLAIMLSLFLAMEACAAADSISESPPRRTFSVSVVVGDPLKPSPPPAQDVVVSDSLKPSPPPLQQQQQPKTLAGWQPRAPAVLESKGPPPFMPDAPGSQPVWAPLASTSTPPPATTTPGPNGFMQAAMPFLSGVQHAVGQAEKVVAPAAEQIQHRAQQVGQQIGVQHAVGQAEKVVAPAAEQIQQRAQQVGQQIQHLHVPGEKQSDPKEGVSLTTAPSEQFAAKPTTGAAAAALAAKTAEAKLRLDQARLAKLKIETQLAQVRAKLKKGSQEAKIAETMDDSPKPVEENVNKASHEPPKSKDDVPDSANAGAKEESLVKPESKNALPESTPPSPARAGSHDALAESTPPSRVKPESKDAKPDSANAGLKKSSPPKPASEDHFPESVQTGAKQGPPVKPESKIDKDSPEPLDAKPAKDSGVHVKRLFSQKGMSVALGSHGQTFVLGCAVVAVAALAALLVRLGVAPRRHSDSTGPRTEDFESGLE